MRSGARTMVNPPIVPPPAGELPGSPQPQPPTTEGPARETVAVVIPTYNVETIIRRCLESVAWADEIIIIDMFSTDRTVEICQEYPNVRLFRRNDYIFGNVNFGMEQARTDWVIRLDSDEIPNEELQRSILHVLSHPEPDVSGYCFPSVQYMFGRPMRYGPGLRERNIRKCMFRRGTARYECRSEHEDITSTGKLKVLSGHYDHLTNHTVEEVIRKFNYYAERDIERLDPGSLTAPDPWRITRHAVRMFFRYYVQLKGHRDGHLGFFSSLFRGPIYVLIEEAKRWEAWANYRERSESPVRGGETQSP
jgi:glycosyltransferase involved in cell wall biosynthesis